MNHSFDVSTAEKYGVEEAIFIENMRFWLAKNKANERHFYDGRYWTYNSAKAFAKLFPYWSASQVNRIIKKLESAGVLVPGNYNQSAYDRTKWYSLNEEIHFTNPSNGNDESVKTLIRTDSKPEINTDGRTVLGYFFDQFWFAYPKKVGKDATQKAFEKRKPDSALLRLMIEAIDRQKELPQWQKDGGQYIPNPATWLNQGRWMDETTGEPSSLLAGGI